MSFHGYSEDEESPVLQNFVNETLARQTQTPSPRSELLSPTPPPAELPAEISLPRRSPRGPSDRYRRQREEAYANVSSRQLLALLIEKEYEAHRLRKALHRIFDRFDSEARRVAEAERVTQEALSQLRIINEKKNDAERSLTKTTEELGMWKFQFDHAQAELARAQEVVRLVERQRNDAEHAASKARTTARQLNERRLVAEASEEGWRLGYQAGLRRARDDMAFVRGPSSPDTYQDLEIEDGGRYAALQPQNGDGDGQGTNSTTLESIPLIHQIPPSQSPQPPMAEAPPSMPAPIVMPSPIPASPSLLLGAEPVGPLRSPSPRVSIYSIEIPSASELNAQPANYPPQRRVSSNQRRPPPQPQDNPPERSFTSQPHPPEPENIIPLRPRSSVHVQTPAPPAPENNFPAQRRSSAQFQQQPNVGVPPPIIPLQRPPSAQFQQQAPAPPPPEKIVPAQRRSSAQFQQQQNAGVPPPIIPLQRPSSAQFQQQNPAPPAENIVPAQRRSSAQFQQQQNAGVPPPIIPLQRPSSAQFQQQNPAPPAENIVPAQRRSSAQFQQQQNAGVQPPMIPLQRPSSAQFQQPQNAAPPPPPPEKNAPPPRPLSQAASHRSRRSTNTQAAPPRSPQEPQYILPPDNYIPSVSEDGGIALPPPFQLAHPLMSALSPKVAPVDPPRPQSQSWYTREQEQQQAQGPPQGWYAQKRPRSNAGSVSGLSAAGSTAGRSQGRHVRQASLDSRLSAAKGQKLAASQPYAADLGAIREVDARSVRSGRGYAGSQRSRSVGGVSEVESAPPPVPAKDERHLKQIIADELRYSDPDLPESWRREAAARVDSASTKSGPPRNTTKPASLVFPSPLSPPNAPLPLGSIRARTMSGGTENSGRTQPLPVDLTSGRSLRHVTPRHPVSPSDSGTPFFGAITIEPPSQSSSSQIPFTESALPPTDRYLSPNYQTQPLPVQVGQPGPGFVPQSVTIPAQITVPVNSVTLKGKPISSPISPVSFPGSEEPHPVSIRAPGASAGRPRGGSTASLQLNVEPLRILSHKRSNSAMSRKSGKSGKSEALPVNVGPTLTAGPTLTRQASNTSLRSTGSAYAQFVPATYVDPAYYAEDHNAPRSRKVSAASNHSGLSYIGPPGPP